LRDPIQEVTELLGFLGGLGQGLGRVGNEEYLQRSWLALYGLCPGQGARDAQMPADAELGGQEVCPVMAQLPGHMAKLLVYLEGEVRVSCITELLTDTLGQKLGKNLLTDRPEFAKSGAGLASAPVSAPALILFQT
jgi:hypothetical protein